MFYHSINSLIQIYPKFIIQLILNLLITSHKFKTLIVNSKDKLRKDEKTGVVYKLNCSCKKSYIGETKWNVNTRIKEHKQDAKKKADKVISRRILNNPSRKIDFDHIHILDSENNKKEKVF